MPQAAARAARAEIEQPAAPQQERRLVVIGGRAAPSRSPRLVEVQRRRPRMRVQERAAYRPDRVAMWAVLLGVLLILAAAASAHGGL